MEKRTALPDVVVSLPAGDNLLHQSSGLAKGRKPLFPETIYLGVVAQWLDGSPENLGAELVDAESLGMNQGPAMARRQRGDKCFPAQWIDRRMNLEHLD